MGRQEDHFKEIYAAGGKERAKSSSSWRGMKMEKRLLGCSMSSRQSDFYHLYGKDNVVLFYTNRYVEQPLVVKGAGAGAEVTASGVFADIVRAAHN